MRLRDLITWPSAASRYTAVVACSVVIGTAVLGVAPRQGAAQYDSLTVPEGSYARLYLEAHDSTRLEGTVAWVESGSRLLLSMEEDGDHEVDPASLARVEIRWPGNRGKTSLVGLLVGAIGLAGVVAITDGCGEGDFLFTPGQCYGLAAGVGGVFGALFGVAVGRGTQWVAVPRS